MPAHDPKPKLHNCVCHRCPTSRDIERLASICTPCAGSIGGGADCGTCKHWPKVEAARASCGSCRGPSDNFGRNVHIDAADDPRLILRHIDTDAYAIMTGPSAQSRADISDPDGLELLARILGDFGTLTDEQAAIVALRLRAGLGIVLPCDLRRPISTKRMGRVWADLASRNPVWSALADFVDRHAALGASRESGGSEADAARSDCAAHDTPPDRRELHTVERGTPEAPGGGSSHPGL